MQTLFQQERKSFPAWVSNDGRLVVEQNERCEWNELAFEVNGHQMIIGKEELHQLSRFFYTAMHGMNAMQLANYCPDTWEGIQK